MNPRGYKRQPAGVDLIAGGARMRQYEELRGKLSHLHFDR